MLLSRTHNTRNVWYKVDLLYSYYNFIIIVILQIVILLLLYIGTVSNLNSLISNMIYFNANGFDLIFSRKETNYLIAFFKK